MINRYNSQKCPPQAPFARQSQPMINHEKAKSPRSIYTNNPHNNYNEANNYYSNSNLVQQNANKPLISPKKQNRLESDRDFPLEQFSNQRAFTNFNQKSKDSKRNLQQSTEYCCANHTSKKADFAILISSTKSDFFCDRCAAQYVTQGYQFRKIDRVEPNKAKKIHKNELPFMPEYESEPLYFEIMQFLNLCNKSLEEQNSQIDRFSCLEEQYNQQIQLTAGFYNRLIEIVEEQKEDHLEDLRVEMEKNTQIADIQAEDIRQNIIEIQNIKDDIESNIASVMEGVKENEYREECFTSLKQYTQKLELFKHQTEQQMEFLKDVTQYSQEKLNSQFLNFEEFLLQMWHQDANDQFSEEKVSFTNNPQSNVFNNRREQPREMKNLQKQNKSMNSAMTVKNIHKILPKGVNQISEVKKPFRNLNLEEEEEMMEDRKSPVFKNI